MARNFTDAELDAIKASEDGPGEEFEESINRVANAISEVIERERMHEEAMRFLAVLIERAGGRIVFSRAELTSGPDGLMAALEGTNVVLTSYRNSGEPN